MFFCFYMNKIRNVFTLHKLSNNTLPIPSHDNTKQNQERKSTRKIQKNITAFKCVGLHQMEIVIAATKPTKRDTNIVP